MGRMRRTKSYQHEASETQRPNVAAADPATAERTAAGRANTRARSRKNVVLGAIESHLGYYARRLQIAIFQDFIRRLALIDIRPAQYSVLVVIGANPGLSQADLADTLGIERARLVRLLDRLEKRGLTRRLPAPADRRSHALQLTVEGQKVLKDANALADEHENWLAERLGPERHRNLLTTLREFTE